jgi:hypothetical protein
LIYHLLRHLLHPLKVLWRERIDLFWPIWVAITVVGVMLVIWMVPQRERAPLDPTHPRRHDWSRASLLAVAFLSVFLACYIAGLLVWEDFTYSDDSLFTLGTLTGQNIPFPIWPNEGRFWPLGDQEYNLLRHVTSSVTGYHALRIVQLVLLSGILLFFDEELSVKSRVALITLALITPSILISFSGLIYPESNLIFSLACLAWSVKRFEQTRSTAWAVAAVMSSQFMLYYKETAFLLLLGFAVGRLLLRCWNGDPAGWDFKRLRDPESRLDACLAFLVAPFLLYYIAAMFPSYSTRYADDFRLSFSQVLSAYLKVDLLAAVFVAVVLARVILILRRKVVPSLLWDGLALGGIAYVASYLALRMEAAYYFAPVDLIALLYLGRLAMLYREDMGLGTKRCAVALLTLVLLQDLSLSAFRMYERKNVIHAKAEMGRVIEARYESDPQNAKRLFFPFARPNRVMEFGAYLNYRGVPMERVPDGTIATGNVVMVGKAIREDGPCVRGKPLVCHAGARPDPGDLIVLLPDDFTRTDELNSYRQDGSPLLFSYHPRPSIPRWLRSYVNRLHVVSPAFAHDPLPDLWLNASVSMWK